MLERMRNQNHDAWLQELGCIDCALGDHIDKLIGGRYLGDVASLEVLRIEEGKSGFETNTIPVEKQVSSNTESDG